VFGIFVEKWLVTYLGKPGTGIALLFVLIVFLILIGFFSLFNVKFSFLNIRRKKKKEKDGKEEKDGVEKIRGRGDKYNLEDYEVKDEEDENNEDIDDSKEKGKLSGNTFKPITQQPFGQNSDASKSDNVDSPFNTLEIDLDVPEKDVKTRDVGEVDFTIENPVVLPDTDANGDLTEKEGKSDLSKSDKPVIKSRYGVDSLYDPRLDLPHYKFPTFDLLNDYGGDTLNVQNEELMENKQKIVATLNHYGIDIVKIKATIGPTVTLYEIIPAPGVRIAKIRNLEDDIALSLSALGIRIIAPIPGKGTIGIEVPNQHPDIVSMKSVLASEKFQASKAELPFGMGKTISNEVFIADLAKMPHILMAGATGQGKSVGLNAIITSLLYKKHPAELKFVMVDPKKVELTLFSKIERHYLAKLPDSEEAIITDTRKVVRTLNSLGIEMDTRYELLKDAQVRNIKEYNVKFLERKLNPNDGHHFMPYIVLVIDEFADLIMTSGKEIEIPLTRLAQLARAVGIHLIIATQRPSVNIITGSIKANFPARVAFRVISKVDSRTILDSRGADQLIGRGDMLLSTGSDLIRLQCAFIDTPEIEKLTEFIGSQRAYPDAYLLPEFADEQDEHITEFDPTEKDQLFEESARILVQTQQGSTSLLQRKLKIGYNRAGRIIDQLEAAGIVGPFEGSKAREVIIKSELELEQLLSEMNNKL
jgi:S-DNA-T family DNA segregation ATPase FtsK/SpoIIIE